MAVIVGGVEDFAVFENAVKSIIELLRGRVEARIICYVVPQIDLAKRIWQTTLKCEVAYPDATRLLKECLFKECMELEPVKKCLDLMLERDFPKHLEMRIVDSEGRPVENPDYRPFLMGDVLGTLVHRYLEAYGFEFNREKFKRLYDEMAEYIYSKDREYVVVSPLENFELQGVAEVLIGKYRIRELSEWEMQQLIAHGYSLGSFFSPEFGDIEIKYCVEIIVRVPKSRSPDLKAIESFVAVLRLFKRGNVKHSCILYYPRIWRTSLGMSIKYRSELDFPLKYVLSIDDVDKLNSFMQEFSGIEDRLPNPVKFAIRWFNKSYEEREALDRLLDLAIALEVLFGVSDRLDLYVPHFISSSKEERIKISKAIKELRKIRGSIVHRGYYSVEREFVDYIEDVTRSCISKFISLLPSATYEEILEDLRNSILE